MWTFSHENIADHRQQVCNSLHAFLLQHRVDPGHTDIAYESDALRVPFPFYKDAIFINYYYYYPIGFPVQPALQSFRRQDSYKCPDQRGLDEQGKNDLPDDLDRMKDVDKETAHALARAMTPICYRDYDESGVDYLNLRPDINCNHLNDTTCMMSINDDTHVYMRQLWYPTDMLMRRFCTERSAS